MTKHSTSMANLALVASLLTSQVSAGCTASNNYCKTSGGDIAGMVIGPVLFFIFLAVLIYRIRAKRQAVAMGGGNTTALLQA